MKDVEEEHVMTRFLLGTTEEHERELIRERLAADPSYFERMAALDDALILQALRHELSPETQELFDKAYLTSPARRARVEQAKTLLDVARDWQVAAPVEQVTSTAVTAPSRRLSRITGALKPHLSYAAGVLLVIGFAMGYLTLSVTGNGVPTRETMFATTLTAVGEKAPGAASGLDLLRIPAETTRIVTSFAVGVVATSDFVAELESPEGNPVSQPSILLIEPEASTGSSRLTVSFAPPQDGDYVLQLRRGAGGPSVAAQAFRITRWKLPN